MGGRRWEEWVVFWVLVFLQQGMAERILSTDLD